MITGVGLFIIRRPLLVLGGIGARGVLFLALVFNIHFAVFLFYGTR